MNTTTNRIRIAFATVVVALGLLAGCGGGSAQTDGTDSSSSSTTTSTSVPTTEDVTLIATANVSELDVFAGPHDTEPTHQLGSLPDYPLVLLVVEPADGERIQVALPTRPNGSTGWVRASDVTTAQSSYQLEVDLSDRRLTAHDHNGVILETTVAVGTSETPTPTGRFFITELVQPPDPTGAYGPYVFALSAHSDVLEQFGGGDGQVGIHGTNQPQLLGSDVSHGCIRVANEDILRLTELLPLGTPVDIRA